MSARCIIRTAPTAKFGHDDPADALALAGGLELVDRVRAQPGGADHRRRAGRDRGESVVEGFRWLREVDQGARPLVAQEGRQVVAELHPAHVLDPRFGLESTG